MLLPTMNEEERLYEVIRQTRWLYDWVVELGCEISDKFKRSGEQIIQDMNAHYKARQRAGSLLTT